MASKKSGTTMAKLARENAVRVRRMEKQARKDARRTAASQEASRPGAEPAIGEGS